MKITKDFRKYTAPSSITSLAKFHNRHTAVERVNAYLEEIAFCSIALVFTYVPSFVDLAS